jgi:FkbM family methyltransferase
VFAQGELQKPSLRCDGLALHLGRYLTGTSWLGSDTRFHTEHRPVHGTDVRETQGVSEQAGERTAMSDTAQMALRVLNLPKIGRYRCFRGAENEAKFIYREIFEDREYAPPIIAWQPGMTIVDVGANIGLFATFAHQQCQGRCRIFCFEPIPQTHDLLRKNLSDRGWLQDGTITTLNAGLTRFDGPATLEFLFFPRVPGNSTAHRSEKTKEIGVLQDWAVSPDGLSAYLAIKYRWSKWFAGLMHSLFRWKAASRIQKMFQGIPVRCQLTTLTAACEAHHIDTIDLLKIDVEGAELDVLQGISDRVWSTVKQIVLEVHDIDDRVDQIKQMLAKRGFLQIEVTRPTFAQGTPSNDLNVYATRRAAQVSTNEAA